VSPEASSERLAELIAFYQQRRTLDASTQPESGTSWSKPTAPAASEAGGTGPLVGEINRVASRHLSFGKNSKEQKPFRPVVALGRVRPPFYLGLAQTTTTPGNARLFFEIHRRDYEVNVGDDTRWPKWLFRFPEKVPLGEQRRYLGRLNERAMKRIGTWLDHGMHGPSRAPTRDQQPASSTPLGSDGS
jgi:hypothetical protein